MNPPSFFTRRLDGRSPPESRPFRALSPGWIGRGFAWMRSLPGRISDRQPRSGRDRRVAAFKLCAAILAIGAAYLVFLWFTLPDIGDPRSLFASQSTVILDRNGIELYRLHGEQDRTYIEGDLLPEHLKEAFIAIEDARYYERGCIDWRALLRAVVFLGRAGGGSTITRQLARNALGLVGENRYQRKIKELILGCQLERRFSKEALLELYLNWIPFGQNAYGVEQAARAYFGTSAVDLTLGQSAVLAALPQRPSYFSPYGRHRFTEVSEAVEDAIVRGEITRVSQVDDDDITVGLLGTFAGTGTTLLYVGGRTDQVMRNMETQGFITEGERLSALEELEHISFQASREDIRAPYFVLWVREEVENLFGGTAEEGILEQGGLRIETTLDWELQQIAEEVFTFHRDDLLERYGAQNLALLSVDLATREILAYVGNADFGDSEHGGKIDMVRAPRQPGSSFKPIVYASAFRRGVRPSAVLWDVPTKIGDDEPQNFDGEFLGPLTIRHALGASRNLPAAKAFFLAGGEEEILALATALGAPTPHENRQQLQRALEGGFDYGWPLALGAAETPLFEMVQAYSSIAAGGVFKPMVGIRRILDRNSNLLFEAQQEEEEVLDPRIAYQITSILSDESARPEGYWRSQLTVPGFQTAGKTGTSNKCMEKNEETGECLLLKPDNAWLIGYTPELVTGVWAGNADATAMFEKGGGLNTASPLWRDYMARAHRRIENPQTEFAMPDGMTQVQVSLLSGEFPTECTPVYLRGPEVFLEENVPSEPDPVCQQLTIDRVTRLLASESCPARAREEGSFLVARSELPERFPEWEEAVQVWAKEQTELWYSSPDHSGAIIPLPLAPTGRCDPDLTPGRLVQPELKILIPASGGSTTYPVFKPQLRLTVGSSVREVLYELDGKRVARAAEEPFERALRVPRSIAKAGLHTLTVTLTDEYYNQASDSVRFSFEEDTVKPAVNLVSPVAGSAVSRGATVTIKADARDPNGAIKYVQFYLDDVLLTTKPSEPFELEYTLSVDPGRHVIRVEAEDMAKNKASDEVEIHVR